MNGTTYTAPTNFTERADVRSAASASGVSATIDTYLQPTAGSSGTIAGTASSADYNVGGSFAVAKYPITHALVLSDVTSGTPVVDDIALGANYQLTTNYITTSQPTLDTPTLTQNYPIS